MAMSAGEVVVGSPRWRESAVKRSGDVSGSVEEELSDMSAFFEMSGVSSADPQISPAKQRRWKDFQDTTTRVLSEPRTPVIPPLSPNTIEKREQFRARRARDEDRAQQVR
jgi:hypothetical protein